MTALAENGRKSEKQSNVIRLGGRKKAPRSGNAEGRHSMEHRVRVTVLDKKLYPELQAQFCANPVSGKCPCYNVGDEFLFERNDERDDFWHMGAGTLIKSGEPDGGVLRSPGTMHCGTGAFRSARRRGTPSAGTSTPRCRAGRSCAAGRRTTG